MRQRTVTFMLAVLLAYVAQGSVWYIMPFLFSNTLSNNYLEVGLVIALIPLIETISAIPFGFFAEFGRIKTVAFDSMLALLVVPLLFAAKAPLVSALGVFLLGIGGVGIWIAATAHMANTMGKRDVRFIGYEFAVMYVGWFSGPMLGGFVYGNYGNMPLAACETLLFAVASFLFARTLNYRSDVGHVRIPKFSKLLSIESGMLSHIRAIMVPFLLISFMASFFSYAVWVAVPLITHISSENIFIGGVILGAIEVPNVLGFTFGSRFYKRSNAKRLAMGSLLLASLFVALSAFLLSKSFFSLLLLLASSGFVTFADVGLFSAIVDRDKRVTGEISALAVITGGFGGAIASLISGATVASLGLFIIAAIFGVLAVVTALYIYVTIGRHGSGYNKS